jgi:predicted transcriptional regulator
MKTIAIDEATAKLIDELTQLRRLNRSALVRTAVRQYAERERRRVTETKDGEIFRKHRKSLARQARALISEQARS